MYIEDIVLKSDCAGGRLAGVAPQLLHSNSHHLCTEEFRFFLKVVYVMLVKTPAIRQQLLECLKEAGVFFLLQPLVISHWDTWQKAAKYHSINLKQVNSGFI